MKIKLYDRSLYFKGLLVLIRKNRRISDGESGLVKEIGAQLGFDKKFIQECLDNLLINKNISDDPPKFTSLAVAESFIKDGFKLSISDEKLDDSELEFLKAAALINGISEEEFKTLYRMYHQMRYEKFPATVLEIENFVF